MSPQTHLQTQICLHLDALAPRPPVEQHIYLLIKYYTETSNFPF